MPYTSPAPSWFCFLTGVTLAWTLTLPLDAVPIRKESRRVPPRSASNAPKRTEGWARVKADDTIFRVGPSTDHDRRTPLTAGVLLHIVGRHDGWLRVRLGSQDEGWVEEGKVEWLAGPAPGKVEVRTILVRPKGRETFVDIALNRRAAFDLVEAAAPGGLRIRLHDATLTMHELARYAGDPLLSQAKVCQTAPGCADLELRFKQQTLWGYKALWVDDPHLAADPPGHDFSKLGPHTLRIVLRHPPASARWQDVAVVIDPGHGGSDSGAVGVGGLAEKQANLEVGLALKNLLEAQGARVVMTRDSDRSVATSDEDELSARVKRAAEGRGDVFVSIHHNARPGIDDSRLARGSFVYYYQTQSMDLAEALTAPLAQAAGEPAQAFVWRSFHVIRQTWMPAVLTEVGFISNPQTEQTMRSPEYAPRIAEGLLKGLQQFLKQRLGTP